MAEVKLDLRTDDILLQLSRANPQAMKAAAFAIEGRAKVNIQRNGQIVTGFMMNSGYTGWRGGNNYGLIWPTGRYKSGNGRTTTHVAAGPADPGDAEAFIHFAAVYSIFQEMKKSFLYAAAEEVASMAAGEAGKVFKDNLS